MFGVARKNLIDSSFSDRVDQLKLIGTRQLIPLRQASRVVQGALELSDINVFNPVELQQLKRVIARCGRVELLYQALTALERRADIGDAALLSLMPWPP